MSKESELEFLLRRATEEVEIADLSRDPVAARIHREMALIYARKVAEYGERPPLHMPAVPPAVPLALD